MYVQNLVSEGDVINGPHNEGTVLVDQTVWRESGDAFVGLTFQDTDTVGELVQFVKQTVILSGDIIVHCDSDVGTIQTETFTRTRVQSDTHV